ncbi:hypothetical protein LBMAG27_18870 [Bacteroidota bacterium]|nr:hypothetical protein LBMAG27_18870 [Bacteroidota bacterium]
MIAKSSKRFLREVEKIKSAELIDEILFVLEEIEQAKNTNEITGLKLFTTHIGYGRIRVNDYRIGIQVSAGAITLKTVLHRSVVYKYFP